MNKFSVPRTENFLKHALSFSNISKYNNSHIEQNKKCGIIIFGIWKLDSELWGVLMRLDKFLKQNRIIKRRTIAQEVSKAGLVKKDGRPLKPSYEVKPGDMLEVIYGSRIIVIKVTEDMKYEKIEEYHRGDEDEELD